MRVTQRNNELLFLLRKEFLGNIQQDNCDFFNEYLRVRLKNNNILIIYAGTERTTFECFCCTFTT